LALSNVDLSWHGTFQYFGLRRFVLHQDYQLAAQHTLVLQEQIVERRDPSWNFDQLP
jgi:hypothetical protein